MKLSYKLFIALLTMALGAAGLLTILLRMGIDDGFIAYNQAADSARLDALVPVFEQLYDDQTGWDGLRPPPRGNRPPPPDAPVDTPPPPADNDQEAPWDVQQSAETVTLPPAAEQPGGRPPARVLLPRLAPELPALGDRFSAYDAQGSLVLGHHVFASNIMVRELHKGGQLIGYLGLASLPASPMGAELAFMRSQYRHVMEAAALILMLAVFVSIWLSRHLVTGIGDLVKGNAALQAGDFSIRLPLRSHDELGRLTEDFNRLAQSLERAEVARKQWSADIAHELRTPLTVLRAELESIQDGVYAMDSKRVDLLHQDVLQLTRLVEDLNVLAMADLGSLHYHLSPVVMDRLVEQVADTMQARCAENGLTLVTRLGGNQSLVKADAQKITQLLGNLLENACRYTDAPGTIQITTRRHSRTYELMIEDSAPGVPDWALSRLFDRLFRLDKSRSRAHGGSGLGLAICQTIVAAHN